MNCCLLLYQSCKIHTETANVNKGTALFVLTTQTGMADSQWKEKLTAFGSDGCAVMTGRKNGVWGLLRNDPSAKNFKEFWCGAHKIELAVVKSLEHFEEFTKLRETLQSFYKVPL